MRRRKVVRLWLGTRQQSLGRSICSGLVLRDAGGWLHGQVMSSWLWQALGLWWLRLAGGWLWKALSRAYFFLSLYWIWYNIASFVLCSGVLVCRGMWDLSSQTRGWTCTPCIGKWSLNHWTTREVQYRWPFYYQPPRHSHYRACPFA